MSSSRGLRYVVGTAALCGVFLFHGTSSAHFELQSPPASTVQNGLGDPQKAPPCGDDGTAVATNIVTQYEAGATITVTIDERIFHPGHYRIAIADTPEQLPAEPVVTPDAVSPCGSAPIQDPPVFPVLADGVFEHTTEFAGPQTIEITLPDDLSCTNCTLQVIEFMSNHALNVPGGCFYHHCATIDVGGEPGADTTTTGDGDSTSDGGPTTATTATTAGGTSTAGATTAGADDNASAGETQGVTTAVTDTDPGQAPEDSEGGCACSLTEGGTPNHLAGLFALLGIAALGWRRSEAARGRS